MNIGDRYYYTGDQANVSDFGTITKLENDKWGSFFFGKLDDGREQKRIHLIAFEKGVGQRFKTIEQYNQEREIAFKRLEQFISKK